MNSKISIILVCSWHKQCCNFVSETTQTERHHCIFKSDSFGMTCSLQIIENYFWICWTGYQVCSKMSLTYFESTWSEVSSQLFNKINLSKFSSKCENLFQAVLHQWFPSCKHKSLWNCIESDVHFCCGISHQMTKSFYWSYVKKSHKVETFYRRLSRENTKDQNKKEFNAAAQMALFLNFKIRNNFNNKYC